MPVRVTPEQYQEKHARRLKAAVPDIQAGIARVTASPTAKAADHQAKMLARLTDAVTSGKWALRLRAVSVDAWKQAALAKGVPRIASGIDGASAKVIAMASKLIPFENTLLTRIESMPDATIEDSINRMTAWARGMALFTGA